MLSFTFCTEPLFLLFVLVHYKFNDDNDDDDDDLTCWTLREPGNARATLMDGAPESISKVATGGKLMYHN